MIARKATPPTLKNIPERTRTAYHEAGHAVLSAAISYRPQHTSIRAQGHTLGRSGARKSARSTSLIQVLLAGFAAEHLLAGRRSRQLDQEVGFAIMALGDRALSAAFAGSEDQDGHRAVQGVLATGVADTDHEIRREIDRLYDVARESLSAIWPAVEAVAKALLKHEELDRDGVDEALGEFDLYTPVIAVQRTYGLMPAAPAAAAPKSGPLKSDAKPGKKSATGENADARVATLLKAFGSDSQLAPVVAAFEAKKRHASGRKFGSNGLKANGKLFALFTQDTLVVKLPKERVEALVERGVGKPFDPGHGRQMKEWLTITSAKASWLDLAKEAHEFVGGRR